MTVPDPDASTDLAWRKERFRVLYDQLYDDLWRYCRRRADDDESAADVLSEVMLVAWHRLEEIPPGERSRPWLFGVARNQLRSGWRRKTRSANLTERLIGELASRPSADQMPTGDLEVLAAALGDLNHKDRELIQLSAWDELPQHEIAQILGCTENAVAIRLHRARQRLTTHMERRS